uniref:Queuosine 5'-phosphate N-glycosylase/hydrolase n=1 Tax=Anguilla anguilla TaxID=7936 RepID=A0A0E9VD01_ANGAN
MEARGEGSIPNLDYLTMFADYRVPQALVYLGALRYSDSLMNTLKEECFSPQEIAGRWRSAAAPSGVWSG